MSTKVIRMMAPWLAQGKLEILSEMLKEWLLCQGLRNLQNAAAAATVGIGWFFGDVPLLRKNMKLWE